MSDLINLPDHYRWHPSGVECKTIAREFSFNAGAAIKYIWRHAHKGKPVEDLRKAVRMLEDEIARLESEEREEVPVQPLYPSRVVGRTLTVDSVGVMLNDAFNASVRPGGYL